MWHKHPQQQQRGIPMKPPEAPPRREAHAAGDKGCTTTCDVNGMRQPGWARPATVSPSLWHKLENEAGSALP